jgi:hypothetical protein
MIDDYTKVEELKRKLEAGLPIPARSGSILRIANSEWRSVGKEAGYGFDPVDGQPGPRMGGGETDLPDGTGWANCVGRAVSLAVSASDRVARSAGVEGVKCRGHRKEGRACQ